MDIKLNDTVAFSSIFVCVGALFLSIPAKFCMVLGTLFLLCGTLVLIPIVITGKKIGSIHVEGKREDAIDTHRQYLSLILYYIFIGTLGIEIGVRKMGKLQGDPFLIMFHFSFVFLATTSFICASYFFSGIKNKRKHPWFAYAFLVTYVSASVTGTLLLLECLKV